MFFRGGYFSFEVALFQSRLFFTIISGFFESIKSAFRLSGNKRADFGESEITTATEESAARPVRGELSVARVVRGCQRGLLLPDPITHKTCVCRFS
jgi:hypothetical protein